VTTALLVLASWGVFVPTPPDRPKIYHITHIVNLPSIINDGGLVCDAEMNRRGGPATSNGMSRIKERRLSLPVPCHPGDHVGDYVPFFFCPRSVMLYILHRGNRPGLTYHEGQEPIIHLAADLYDVLAWANAHERRWAFTLANAATAYATFRNDVSHLYEIDWFAVATNNFQARDVQERKQAEFLLHGFFPWELVSRIGVHSRGILMQARASVAAATHRPDVSIQRGWYF
jgi:hypothetical protein